MNLFGNRHHARQIIGPHGAPLVTHHD
jgi:hypothetical protein